MAARQELILYSRNDLERSIPCMVDGLKTGQRKILYCCFKRNLKKDIKARPCLCLLRFVCALHETDACSVLHTLLVGRAILPAYFPFASLSTGAGKPSRF